MNAVGRYRLTRRLGQGGMAEVLEAVAEGEAGFRRRVAIKRILPELANDASCARMFLDEARITSHLHHANIVPVLDYGTVDGVPFQVLELVDGLDLDRLMRRAGERDIAVPIGLMLYVVLQVAFALDHAHDARDEQGVPLGIVHRDVSPSNVLVSWDGQVKLGDFGIALAQNRVERTVGAGVKGKLEYMSPEQAVRGHVDRRSDVFALGCMLHRLIAGQSPLAELSALTRVVSGEELALHPSLDPPIAEIIAKATRSAQTARYGTAQELARALGLLVPRYLTEEPTGALRRFLTGLRDLPASQDKRGALDALLDLQLVIAESDQATGERSFRTRTAPQAALAHEQTSALGVQASALPGAVSEPGRTQAGLRVALATLALTALVLTGLVLRARDGQPPRVPAPRSSPVPQLSKPRASPKQSPAPERHEAPSLQAPTLTAPTPTTALAKKARRVADAKLSESKPAAATEPVLAVGRGTLLVGGSGAQRAEIRIDDRLLGFAPKRLELTTGEHELVLVRPDGTRIGPHRVRIDRQHTESAPARFIVD